MKLKKFFSLFDKQRFFLAMKIGLILIGVLLSVNLVGTAYSKYESNVAIYEDAKVAYFVVGQGTTSGSIALTDLLPSDDVYLYPINVYNHDDSMVANVNLKYTISFETTTNLPITLDVIANEVYSEDASSIIDDTEIFQDGDMYYKRYIDDAVYNFSYGVEQMNQYTLVVRFPEEYKNYPDLYQGKIELIKVIIKSEQLV